MNKGVISFYDDIAPWYTDRRIRGWSETFSA